jgi:hypothetical protein
MIPTTRLICTLCGVPARKAAKSLGRISRAILGMARGPKQQRKKFENEACGETAAAKRARTDDGGHGRRADWDEAANAMSLKGGGKSADESSADGHGGFINQEHALPMQEMTHSRSSDGSQASCTARAAAVLDADTEALSRPVSEPDDAVYFSRTAVSLSA